MIVAVKFCDDFYFSNKHYAKIGGIKYKELNQMESQFLKMIVYDLHVLPETFKEYSNKLETQGTNKSFIGNDVEMSSEIQGEFVHCMSQASIKTVPSSDELSQ